jgi:hypothetical protein
MLGSDPSVRPSWALFPQGYALLAGDKDRPWRINAGQPSARPTTARPVRSSVPGRDEFRSRFGVPGPAPTAQQPAAARSLNCGSSPDADQQLKSLIADAMRQLPFEYRAVIYLAYHQRWTIERIADALKITEAAVKSRLHVGLRRLRLDIPPNEAAAVNPNQID